MSLDEPVGAVMKWIAIPLLCAVTVLAQQPKPNHINQDVIGESADEFIDNNPSCAFLSNPEPSRIKPRQRERMVACVPFDSLDLLSEVEENAAYGSVHLKILEAIFLDEDGLVSLAFELKGADYNRLKTQLFTDFGLPDQVSQFEGETIAWDDDSSRIDLQKMAPTMRSPTFISVVMTISGNQLFSPFRMV